MRIKIDVWSDYVCPFCYLEEPVLDRLVREFGDMLLVTWRAFELRPDPVPTLEPNGDYLRDVWARAVYPMAADRGMTLRLPPIQPRSRLALQAAEFAREQEKFSAMHHALFDAFFVGGQNIGDVKVLIEIGKSAGLDAEALRGALREKRYLDRVLGDERLAAELGVSGVPAMFIRRANEPLESAVEISGAQPYEALRTTLDRLIA